VKLLVVDEFEVDVEGLGGGEDERRVSLDCGLLFRDDEVVGRRPMIIEITRCACDDPG